MLTAPSFAIIGVGLLGFALIKRWLANGRRYPPGPPGFPVLGHLFSMPTTNQHVVFHDWAKIYGGIVHISALGRHIVILDDVETCLELLDKRGSIYSDRPHLTIAEVLEVDDLPTISYVNRFRKHRKIINFNLTKTACAQFLDGQLQNAFILASNLIQYGSSECEDSLNIFATSTITKAVSGYLITSLKDEWLGLMKEHATILHDMITLSGSLLEFLPSIKYLPSWAPGAGLPTLARSKAWVFRRIYQKSYEQVQKQLSNESPERCILSEEIRKGTDKGILDDNHVDDLKRIAGALIRAANDTTASTLHIFLYIITAHPEIQTRAQEELDRVVGSERMPQFGDNLPYVSAVVQEVIRWNPVVPLGMPHQSSEDDIYAGYFIPKGTVMIPNIYGMSRDESMYHDPNTFDPMRFFPRPEGRGEPLFELAFGFGRRVCPGRHFAYNSTWIAVATCLATLRVSREVNEHGQEIVPDPQFSTGLVCAPKPFPFKISPRSAKTSALLQAMTQEVLKKHESI